MQRLTYRKFTTRILIVGIVFTGSCVSHDLDNLPCPEEISYSETITQIVNTKCAISGCHNGDLGEQRNWTVYETFSGKKEAVQTKVTQQVMPPASSPAGPLSTDQIKAISCWVDQGAQNN